MNDKEQLTFAELSTTCKVSTVDRENKTVVLESHNVATPLTVPLTLFPTNFRDRLASSHSIRLSLAVESPHQRNEWSRAFALQGQSDLDAYEYLDRNKDLPVCHKLHYLQMAAEKLAKAYELTQIKTEKSLNDLTKRHTGAPIGKFVKSYFKQRRGPALEKAGKSDQLQTIAAKLEGLANEIEKHQPAVDKEKSPQNVEYPWSDGIRILVPSEQPFFVQDFDKNIWNELLETLRAASEDLTGRRRSS